MKTKSLLALLLSVVLLAAFTAGCSSDAGGSSAGSLSSEPVSQSSDSSASGINVTDMMGREITLEEPANRIVALSAADCEILYAIGAGDTLVGRGEYCNYPEAVASVPAVDSGSEMNIEQVIALEPQVLLMSAMAQTAEQVETLEAAGIKVVVSDADTIEDVYTSIEMIGTLMGKGQQAQQVISSMQSAFRDIESKAAGGQGKSVYFEVSPLEYGLWTAGSGTFMDEIADMLGLENAFSDVEGWAEISEEQVLERNPDYIVTITMYYGEGPTPVEEILGRSGWENLTAVKNGAIFNADSDSISRPGPRLAVAAEELYQFVYGGENAQSSAA